MKQRACLTIVLTAIAGGTVAQQTNNPPRVAVPDEATAVKIAEEALTKIYGNRQIQSERPFGANLAEGIWHVMGAPHCKDESGKVVTGACVDAVAMAEHPTERWPSTENRPHADQGSGPEEFLVAE